jgi:two-component system, NtrC family, response regulator HydG
MDGKTEKVRLLMVDDEEEFLEALTPGLERRGFVVDKAHEGKSALMLLSQERYEVVILDVKMPGPDGISVFHQIKQLHPELPVILLTGDGIVKQASATSKEGAVQYLAKPCEVEDLVKVAHHAARRKGVKPSPLMRLDEEIRLLLVDANQYLVANLSETLQQAGILVTAAATFAEALSLLERQVFDVALIEVRRPGKEGLALLRIIKRQSPLTPVLVLSDQPYVETVVEGVKEGAFDFMMKPQKPEVLIDKIHEAFRVVQQQKDDLQRKRITDLLIGRPL